MWERCFSRIFSFSHDSQTCLRLLGEYPTPHVQAAMVPPRTAMVSSRCPFTLFAI